MIDFMAIIFIGTCILLVEILNSMWIKNTEKCLEEVEDELDAILGYMKQSEKSEDDGK